MENICDTEYDDPSSKDWDFYFDTKVIVSNDVLEKENLTLCLKRIQEKKVTLVESILSGYESDDYVNNPKNFQIILIGVILNIDDSILKFLEEPHFMCI
ncbi:immunity protein Imm33 domain-containing protein [Bacillus paranthracis]